MTHPGPTTPSPPPLAPLHAPTRQHALIRQKSAVLQPLERDVDGDLGPGDEAQHPVRLRRRSAHGKRPGVDAQQTGEAQRDAQRGYEAGERTERDGNGQGEAGEEGDGVVEGREETVEVRG